MTYSKICNKCKNSLSIEYFSKDATRKDGYQNNCKSCGVIHRKLKQDYYRKYREAIKTQMVGYHKRYKQSNKARINSLGAKRRAAKLKATPTWLTKEQLTQIQEFYEIAQAFKLYSGKEYHVDHIIPLQGKTVCGLHVPWNLQILEASENISKSNKLQ